MCLFKSGYIRSDKDYYFVEPAADYYPLSGDEHPHLVYKRQSETSDHEQTCYVASNVAKAIAKRAAATNVTIVQQKSAGNNSTQQQQQLHIETLVVMDASLIQYHQSIDLENYVLTVFNMVSIRAKVVMFNLWLVFFDFVVT